MSGPSVEEYTIGWICALQEEYEAACRMLDDEFDGPETAEVNDNNTYAFGRISKHNIVVGCLPHGRYGTSSAASVAKDMVRSFPNLKFALMVGIGGGVPTRERDIRLGDVVVSVPQGELGGVVQYDFGKHLPGGRFQRTGQLDSPPEVLLGALPEMQRRYNDPKMPDTIANHLRLMDDMSDYKRPLYDRLYRADYEHKGGKCCADCEADGLEERAPRNPGREVVVHYGIIASGNSVMKNTVERDIYANDPALNVLCFEMEAGGLMNSLPCLVIRGICDYSDSHKNDVWHKFAALAAAAYTRELLHVLKPRNVVALAPWAKMKTCLADIREGVKNIINDQHSQEDERILEWLTPICYGPQQSDSLKKQQPGTCQWLLDTDEYQNWLKKSNQTLFCPGIPGAGKTILTAIIVNELCLKFQSDTNIGKAYIYCNFRRWDEQNSEHLLASLLKQLIQERSSLPESVKSLYEHHKKKKTRPLFDEISKVLHSVAALYSRLFIIVDALDECQVFDGCRTKLLAEIFVLQAEYGANIFVTSRFVPEITIKFKESVSIEIRASNDDVRRYLDSHISQLPAFVTGNIDLQEEIKTEIVRAAGGMFLLAKLHLESLAGKTSPKSIRTSLKTLPTGSDAYDNAYKKAIQRIEQQHKEQKELAKQVISWITCAKRPLTTFELQHALAVEVGTCELDYDNLSPIQLMVSVCAGLVTIDEASGIIRLVHYTTQKYFERIQKYWFPDAETNITTICVTYLLFNIFEDGFWREGDYFKERLESNRLYDYAAQNWGHHARMSSIEGDGLILNFLRNKTKVSACTQAMMGPKTFYMRNLMTGLHVAAYFGLRKSTAALLEGQISPSPIDIDGWTPLHWAAENGHQEVVKLLLDKGTHPNIKTFDGMTALYLAAKNGHRKVVKLLLEKGADSNIRNCGYKKILLHSATENGHQEVVRLLLELGADPNIRDFSHHQTPLHHAVNIDNQQMVKLLLEKNADPNIGDLYRGQTPLYSAAKNSHEQLVKLLLENSADPNIQSFGNMTPLYLAAKNNHEQLVKLLLEYGADPNIHDCDYRKTPLHHAAENGHQEVVRLLLKMDADPNIHDCDYRKTPLHHAAENGHQEVVRLLLKMDADPSIKDVLGKISLHYAAEKGHQEVVELLLNNNADPNIKDLDIYSQLPLHYATKNGYQEVVRLLLEKDADPDIQDFYHRQTPLHHAAKIDDQQMVKLLLEKNADPNIQNTYGRTPLHRAAKNGNQQMVKMLLDKDAYPNIEDDGVRTPVDYAAENGHHEVVELLLSKGAKEPFCK